MRRLLVAAALAVLTLATIAPAVHAECMSWPIRATERPQVRYAFTATVTDLWRDPETVDDDIAFDWRTEFTVERRYRGRVPDRIVANGWYVGCHYLRGDALSLGDRIFIASSDFQPHDNGLEPFSVINGQTLLVWRRSGSRWEFFEDGLDFGPDKTYYPKEARAATTTADILALISAATAPDTSTVLAPRPRDGRTVVPVLALAFIAGFVVASMRLRSWMARPVVSGPGNARAAARPSARGGSGNR